MSSTNPASSSIPNLCRCGRTTTLDDDRVARRRLNCGHYVCPDCWRFNQPLPAPLCITCTVALQGQEVVRLSHFEVAYRELVKHYKELNSAHTQLKAAKSQLEATHNQQVKGHRDQINRLRTVLLQNLGKAQPVANTSQHQAPTQNLVQQDETQAISSPPVAATSQQNIDWNSDQGKTVTKYIARNKELLKASQGECANLKSRIADLTARLEAQSKPDPEMVTAIEKAELMEAELESLHERLDKCEEDLIVAQSELAKVKKHNEKLSAELEERNKKADADRTILESAKQNITSLHNEYQELKDELLAAQAALRGRATSPRARTDSSVTSVDVSILSEKALGKRPQTYASMAANWEQSALSLTTVQKEATRLKQDKATLEKEILELRQKLGAGEDENKILGDKLHQSADLAAHLSRFHISANLRATEAENKLASVRKELQEAKELIEVREKEKQDLETAGRALELAQRSEFMSRVTGLEAEITGLVQVRDAAIAQINVWEQNRDKWKRWGETMALRAKQWEQEARKARKSRPIDSELQLEEPPPLTPVSTTVLSLASEELEHTRKRPLDIPDTDVDIHYNVVPSCSSDDTARGRVVEGRKKARFEA